MDQSPAAEGAVEEGIDVRLRMFQHQFEIEAILNPSGQSDTPYVRVKQMMVERADKVHRLAFEEVRGGNHLAAYSAWM